MSRLEMAAAPMMRPLINDQTITLDEAQQSVLAAWSAKTAMVFECLRPKDTPAFYTRQQRESMMNSRAIPEKTMVWIARYSGRLSPYTNAIPLQGTGHETKRTNRRHSSKGLTFVLTFGHLAIQILTVQMDSDLPITIPVRPGPCNETALQIWPYLRPVEWPPTLTLLDGGPLTLADFCGRFVNP